MGIAGAERGLGACLMVKVTLDAKRGWDRLETKSPGWGSGDRLGGGWKGMIGLLGDHLSEQGSEGERGGLGDDSVAEEA